MCCEHPNYNVQRPARDWSGLSIRPDVVQCFDRRILIKTNGPTTVVLQSSIKKDNFEEVPSAFGCYF